MCVSVRCVCVLPRVLSVETDLDVSRVVSRRRMWRVGGGGGRVGGGC